MASDEIRQKYQATIGIETHVQLKTKTKLFSAVDNNAREATPNSLISHIDIGLPGALPVLNQAALELAVRAAFALNTKPQAFSKFDRKHYFYPDLPKGYQITQYEDPIITGGYVEIMVEDRPKRINITRVHLEEDAGKNTHPQGTDYSLVDLNRAGTPLLEIVSEPDITSPAEAKAYARELYLLMKYADVSDVDLYHGNMRFDINVSVSKSSSQKGTRTEIKNLNSFRSVENAATYEIKRQIEELEQGRTIIQETRGWDEAKQKTLSQRGKEEAHDYRYMPEPDIPPIELSEQNIQKLHEALPELPSSIRQKLSKINIEKNIIEDILDNSLVYDRLSEAIGQQVSPENLRRIAFDSLENPKALDISVSDHIVVAESVTSNLISTNAGQAAISDIAAGKTAKEAIDSRRQLSDEAEIHKIVEQVLVENQKAADDVKQGETKAVGFLVGQVMSKSHGKANPKLAEQIIKAQLNL